MSTFEDFKLWPQQYTVEAFFEMWMNGDDVLANDPGVEILDVDFSNPFTGKKDMMKDRRRRK